METVKNKPLPASDVAQAKAATSQEIENRYQLASPTGTDDAGLDLVRQILFGEQVRETEKKQASLERYIQDSVDALNKETQRQIDVLRGDFQELASVFKEEVSKHDNNSNVVDERFADLTQDISKIAAQSKQKYNELDQRLGHEAERLNEKAEGWRKEILEQLEQATAQLKHDKADRQSIAGLFHDMAQHISGGKDVPDNTQ